MKDRRFAHDRRAGRRLPAADCAWLSSARLRPGPEVSIEDVSTGGARIDAPVRLLPGCRVELVLSGPGWHWAVEAVVVHASVSGLTGHGPRYLAGLRFARRLEVALLRGRPAVVCAG
ncbi:MAG: hypothetical protein H6Q10_89 [Acidobacteria bacterium]|nr:hypothetical protein [Acidobacteriota bacterium]